MIAAVKEDIMEYMGRMETAMDTLKDTKQSVMNDPLGEDDSVGQNRTLTIGLGPNSGRRKKAIDRRTQDAKIKGKKNCDPIRGKCSLI